MINSLFEGLYASLYDRMMGDNFFAFVGIHMTIFLIIVIVIGLLWLIGKWKLYKKAGKKGWEAIVPFYSEWIYVEIAGLEWWYFLFLIAGNIANLINEDSSSLSSAASIISYFGLFLCNYNISKKLNKNLLFAILMTLFPFIMIPLIGFSNDYKWDDSVGVRSNFFSNKNNNDINSNNNNFQNSSSNSYMNDTISYDNNSANNLNSARYCVACGSKLEADTKFCSNCGRKV